MTCISDSEVRRGRKFDQVQAGALRVFLRDGFEGASVDEIAREAGVSKATLYSYFPDKRVMFTEVFSIECQRQASEAETELAQTPPAPEFLTYAARRVIRFALSDFGRSLFRLVVGEVSRFPELARQFYANGPGMLRGKLVARLRELCERGELEITDFDLAVEQFVQLAKAAVHDRVMLNLVEDIRPEEIDKSVEGAVTMFMARYGTKR
nr:TetR/AcrR family transcriptional regulator [Pseudogemmobacter bohemicus]